MPLIYERTQWPVGHGGFHTGRLIQHGRTLFSYFYDCGSHAPAKSKATALIAGELSCREFKVGVISHFDHDHFAAVGHGAPEVLFLPYMTRTDQLLHVLLTSEGREDQIKKSAGIYDKLKAVKAKSKLFMVSSQETGRDNQDVQDILQPLGRADVKCAFPVVSHHTAMHHTDSLHFKFFNYYAGDLGSELYGHLVTALATFSDLKNAPYTTVEALLLDIEDNAAEVVCRNAKALKAVYVALLKGKAISNITASNLSSLTLMSFCKKPGHYFTQTRCSPPQHTLNGNSGWLLTGDLELKDQVWEPFYDHYVAELDNCAVFNLPHHASRIALNWRAMHFLSNELIYLANVNDGDPKHPSPQLYKDMDDFSLRWRHKVTEKLSSAFTLKVRVSR